MLQQVAPEPEQPRKPTVVGAPKRRPCSFDSEGVETYDGGKPTIQVGDPTRTKQYPCARHRELGKKLGWEEVDE